MTGNGYAQDAARAHVHFTIVSSHAGRVWGHSLVSRPLRGSLCEKENRAAIRRAVALLVPCALPRGPRRRTSEVALLPGSRIDQATPHPRCRAPSVQGRFETRAVSDGRVAYKLYSLHCLRDWYNLPVLLPPLGAGDPRTAREALNLWNLLSVPGNHPPMFHPLAGDLHRRRGESRPDRRHSEGDVRDRLLRRDRGEPEPSAASQGRSHKGRPTR